MIRRSISMSLAVLFVLLISAVTTSAETLEFTPTPKPPARDFIDAGFVAEKEQPAYYSYTPTVWEFIASWYGPRFHGRRMANGQRFNMNKLVVAHRTLPLGTCLEIVNPCNGRSVRVIVKDRGPYIQGRNLDVSYRVAQVLDFVNTGVVELQGKLCT